MGVVRVTGESMAQYALSIMPRPDDYQNHR
jgi:hypothetical protein